MSFRRWILGCCMLLMSAPGIYGQRESRPERPAPPPPPLQPLPPPSPPPAPEPVDPNEIDGVLSFEISYGFTQGHPSLRGRPDVSATASPNLVYPGNQEQVPGATLSVPAGRYNNLRFSYFQLRGGGNTVAGGDLSLFSTGYSKGDLLNTHYKVQNAKVSLDYLSYPAPPRGARFRLKTLWEVQYTNFKTAIDTVNKTDSAGNPTSNPVAGSRWFFYPTLGAGIEHLLSSNFRWEAKASGFGIPHHAAIWDAEVWAAYRAGRFEPRVGFRGFHFKTSPKKDQYIGGTTFSGVWVTLRWYPKW